MNLQNDTLIQNFVMSYNRTKLDIELCDLGRVMRKLKPPFKVDWTDYILISFFVWCIALLIVNFWVFILETIFQAEGEVGVDLMILYATALTAIQMIRNFEIKE